MLNNIPKELHDSYASRAILVLRLHHTLLGHTREAVEFLKEQAVHIERMELENKPHLLLIFQDSSCIDLWYNEEERIQARIGLFRAEGETLPDWMKDPEGRPLIKVRSEKGNETLQ